MRRKIKTSKKELEGLFIVNPNKLFASACQKRITGDTDIEIMENLKEGEEVVSGSFQALRTLKDGDRVKVEKSAAVHLNKQLTTYAEVCYERE